MKQNLFLEGYLH